MTYDIKNTIWSPRLFLLWKLKELNIFSEWRKWENFSEVSKEDIWYYFTEEICENNFDLKNSTKWTTSEEFMKKSWFSRPKINQYIEKYWKVIFLEQWFYDFEKLKKFLIENKKEFTETRWRKKKVIS